MRRVLAANGGRAYAVGESAYRSDDGGVNWANLTEYKGASLLGGRLSDLALSPKDPDEIAVASASGVWHSVDGGLSWTGLNQTLPNLPSGRLLGVPNGGHPGSDTGDRGQNSWEKGKKPLQGRAKSDPPGHFWEMGSEKIQATAFVFYILRIKELHGMNLFFVQYREKGYSSTFHFCWSLSRRSDFAALSKSVSR